MLAKVLEYLECPQYLRKAFFPPQPDLKFAGNIYSVYMYVLTLTYVDLCKHQQCV